MSCSEELITSILCCKFLGKILDRRKDYWKFERWVRLARRVSTDPSTPDQGNAKRLWDLSEEQTKVKFDLGELK